MPAVDPTLSAARLTRVQHVLFVLAVIVCRICAVRSAPTYDDAFITYRYAHNLAAGAGLVFNPGAPWEPVLGTTTPLYALVLAGLAWTGANLVAAALVLDILLDAVTAVLLPRFFAFARAPSALALLAFAAFPPLVRITVGGMESPLFVLSGVAAVLALGSGRTLLAGVLASVACLVRPEGVLLCAILFVVLAVRGRTARRDLARFVMPVIVIGGVSVAVLTSVYGTPIPQSVLAKSAMRQGDPLHESVLRWKTILLQSFLPHVALLPLLPFVIAGAWSALRRDGPLRWFSLWALAITASYLVARPHTWGWYYCVPLTAWAAWLGLGASRALPWIAERWSSVRPGSALVDRLASRGPQMLALLAMVAAVLAGMRFRSVVDERVYAPLQAWARATSQREPHARILASDIGAIGWAWKGTVLDSEGLVWPQALELKHPDAMIETQDPEYVLLVAERPRLRHFRARPDLFARYEAVARFSVSGAIQLDPTPEEVPIDWSQDYIAYRRK
jgi:hypothetical protein